MGHHSLRGEGGHHVGLISQTHRQFESVPRIQVMSIQPFDGFVPGQFFTALAQLDRALDYESGGWEFESLRWYQK